MFDDEPDDLFGDGASVKEKPASTTSDDPPKKRVSIFKTACTAYLNKDFSQRIRVPFKMFSLFFVKRWDIDLYFDTFKYFQTLLGSMMRAISLETLPNVNIRDPSHDNFLIISQHGQ